MNIKYSLVFLFILFMNCNGIDSKKEIFFENEDKFIELTNILKSKQNINFIILRNFTDTFIDIFLPTLNIFKIASYNGKYEFEIKSNDNDKTLNQLDSVLNLKLFLFYRNENTNPDSIYIESTLEYFELSKCEIIEIYKIMDYLGIKIIDTFRENKLSFSFKIDVNYAIVFSYNDKIDELNISNYSKISKLKNNWYIVQEM